MRDPVLITIHLSHFSRHFSPHHVSRLTFHASRFTPHVSRLTFHASRFTHHVSRITHWILNYVYIRHQTKRLRTIHRQARPAEADDRPLLTQRYLHKRSVCFAASRRNQARKRHGDAGGQWKRQRDIRQRKARQRLAAASRGRPGADWRNRDRIRFRSAGYVIGCDRLPGGSGGPIASRGYDNVTDSLALDKRFDLLD